MVRWLIEIEEQNVADLPPTEAGGTFTYDATVNCGTLVDGLMKIQVYGENFEQVMRGLIAYFVLRVQPTSGEYDWAAVKARAWELLKRQMGDFQYVPAMMTGNRI
jgi:hypothetical protein